MNFKKSKDNKNIYLMIFVFISFLSACSSYRFNKCEFFNATYKKDNFLINYYLGLKIEIPENYIALDYLESKNFIMNELIDLTKSNTSKSVAFDIDNTKNKSLLFCLVDTTQKKIGKMILGEVIRINSLITEDTFFSKYIFESKKNGNHLIEDEDTANKSYIHSFKNNKNLWWYYVKTRVSFNNYYSYKIAKNYNYNLMIIIGVFNLDKGDNIEDYLNKIDVINWNNFLKLKKSKKSCF